jgi:hypothetical protein
MGCLLMMITSTNNASELFLRFDVSQEKARLSSFNGEFYRAIACKNYVETYGESRGRPGNFLAFVYD